MNKKIVFCGGGNMAEGIIRGLIKNNVSPENIVVSELKAERCDYLNREYSITAVTDATDFIKVADVVIIAVLPISVSSVTSAIKNIVKNDAIIMSIAAGVTLEKLAEQLGSEKKIARVMPNTLGLSGNGYSAVCLNEKITDDEKETVTNILLSIGKPMFLSEDMFSTFTAFSCSGPMWFYKMIDAMVNAGVYEGFSREDSKEMVVENMLGVAKILQMTGDEPSSRVNAMCSPGGVTIEGFRTLEDEGFTSTVLKSVDDAVKKAKSI